MKYLLLANNVMFDILQRDSDTDSNGNVIPDPGSRGGEERLLQAGKVVPTYCFFQYILVLKMSSENVRL